MYSNQHQWVTGTHDSICPSDVSSTACLSLRGWLWQFTWLWFKHFVCLRLSLLVPGGEGGSLWNTVILSGFPLSIQEPKQGWWPSFWWLLASHSCRVSYLGLWGWIPPPTFALRVLQHNSTVLYYCLYWGWDSVRMCAECVCERSEMRPAQNQFSRCQQTGCDAGKIIS